MTSTSIQPHIGQHILDIEGKQVGAIAGIYVDEMTGTPEWVRVAHGGLLPGEDVIVPLDAAMEQEDNLQVPYFSDLIQSAPKVEETDRLSYASEMQLYEYYHVLRILPGNAEERQRRNAENPATWQHRLRKAA